MVLFGFRPLIYCTATRTTQRIIQTDKIFFYKKMYTFQFTREYKCWSFIFFCIADGGGHILYNIFIIVSHLVATVAQNITNISHSNYFILKICFFFVEILHFSFFNRVNFITIF